MMREFMNMAVQYARAHLQICDMSGGASEMLEPQKTHAAVQFCLFARCADEGLIR